MSDLLITKAIDKHGAYAVYKAAVSRLNGDHSALRTVDLIATDLEAANAIMSAAYKCLSKTERAKDYWDASSPLPKDV